MTSLFPKPVATGGLRIAVSDTSARTITVAAGNYHELLYVSGKKDLTSRGADRAGTVIQYPNNDKSNPGTSARPPFFANGTTDLTLENLTLYNSTCSSIRS